jgi:hypothetical protein
MCVSVGRCIGRLVCRCGDVTIYLTVFVTEFVTICDLQCMEGV